MFPTRLVPLAVLAVQSAASGDIAFPAHVYAERRDRLAAMTGPAAIVVPGRHLVNPGDELVKQDPNFWYLTGIESPYAILVMVPESGTAGSTVRPRWRSIVFLPTSTQFLGGQLPMLDEGFRQAVWNRPRRRLSADEASREAIGVDRVYPVDSFVPVLKDLVADVRTLYVPTSAPVYSPPGLGDVLPLEAQFAKRIAALAPALAVKDLAPLVERMRLVKDTFEIALLRKAAAISAAGMLEGMKRVRPGMNDRELAGFMEYVWKREGSDRSSFAPIVSSGPNALTFFSILRENYRAVDRVMRSGDLVFVDYGAAEVDMYTADLCRTWPVSGRFTAEQRKYYEIVLEAQQAAIDAIRPGVMMLDVIKVAARVFQKHGLEPYEDVARMGPEKVWGIMPSPTHYLRRDGGIVRYSPLGRGVRDLGHHIGLEVQDSRDYSMPLAPGMVITIEPKIYIPDKQIAIMIEDMILVTPDGRENLSARLPKRVADIERVMRSGGSR